jgi:hypothetical protein
MHVVTEAEVNDGGARSVAVLEGDARLRVRTLPLFQFPFGHVN